MNSESDFGYTMFKISVALVVIPFLVYLLHMILPFILDRDGDEE